MYYFLAYLFFIDTWYSSVFSYCSGGSQGKNTEVVCHSLSGGPHSDTSPPWPVRLGWPQMAWLSFIELNEAVVCVIRLAGSVIVVSVCLPSDALSQRLPSYMGFTYLGRDYLLLGSAPDLDSLIYVYLCCAVLSHLVMLFIDPESPESGQRICCSIHFQLGWRLGLESSKGSVCGFETTREQIANICWIIEKAREFQKNIYFCFIDYAKAFDCADHNSGKFLKRWEYQTTLPTSWETSM